MKVPFLDLKIQYKEIEQEVLPMVTDAMENASFIGGPQVSGTAKFAWESDQVPMHCVLLSWQSRSVRVMK